MGNQISRVSDQCISCKKDIRLNDVHMLALIDSGGPAYCSYPCQSDNHSLHWQSLMMVSDRAHFNTLLSHLAGVQFKRHTRDSFQKHLCNTTSPSQPCIACKETAKWYRLGAEQDILGAQHSLGYCYSIGMGVPQSDVEAAKWYGKAAAGGYTKSIESLKELFSSISSVLDEDDISELEEADDPK